VPGVAIGSRNAVNRIGKRSPLVVAAVYTVLAACFVPAYVTDPKLGLFWLFAAVAITPVGLRLDLGSPGSLFCIAWFGALAVAQLKLTSWEQDLSPLTWTIVLLGPLVFFVGCWFAQLMLKSVRPNSTHTLELKSNWDLRKVLWFLGLLLLSSVAAFLYQFSVLGGVPMWKILQGGDPIVRFEKLNSYLNRLSLSMYDVATISGLVLLVWTKREEYWGRVARPVLWGLFLLPLILSVTSGGRYYATEVLTIVAFAWLWLRGLRLKTAVLAILVVFAGLSVFGYVREMLQLEYTKYWSPLFSKQVTWIPIPDWLLPGYTYIVIPFTTLEVLANSIIPKTGYWWGWHTFYPVTVFFGAQGLPNTIWDHRFVFNTPTMFGTWFADFGLLGVFFFAFATGLASTLLYRSLIQRPTAFKLYCYSSVMCALAFCWFTNAFANFHFPWGIGVFFVFDMLTRRSGPLAAPVPPSRLPAQDRVAWSFRFAARARGVRLR